jgi:hypothetical protein
MNDRVSPKQKKEYRDAIDEVLNRYTPSDDAFHEGKFDKRAEKYRKEHQEQG